MKKRVVLLFATGLGLGLSPFASGTAGTLLGVAIAVAMSGLGQLWQAGLAAVLVAVAVPVCHAAEAIYGEKDDGRIVADEYLTFPLCVLWLPWAAHPWLLGMAFVTHRLLDIIKPPPARQLQAVKGGVGIVIDDVVSSLYALALNHAVWWAVCRFRA
ncbi:phosphatidylglycerophosphatase A [Verrucomicrobiota bacterium]